MMSKNVILTLLTAGALSASCVETDDSVDISEGQAAALSGPEADESALSIDTATPAKGGCTPAPTAGFRYETRNGWQTSWGTQADYVIVGCWRNANNSYAIRLENWGVVTGGTAVLTRVPSGGLPPGDAGPIASHGGVLYHLVGSAGSYAVSLNTSSFCEYAGNNSATVTCNSSSPYVMWF